MSDKLRDFEDLRAAELKLVQTRHEIAELKKRESLSDCGHLSQLTVRDAARFLPRGLEAEVIPVREVGDEIVLLRSGHVPQCGFLLWDNEYQSTRIQLALRSPVDRQFTLVCACCESEMYGMNRAELDVARESHEDGLKGHFAKLVSDVCLANGISLLFMRTAEKWSSRYGDIGGVKVVEGSRNSIWKRMNNVATEDRVKLAWSMFDWNRCDP